MNNRALEFLNEAYGLLGYPDSGNAGKARLLVRLAIGEVEELANHAARPATATALPQPHGDGDGRGVLIVDAQRMTPAFLAARPRAEALAADDGDKATLQRWGAL